MLLPHYPFPLIQRLPNTHRAHIKSSLVAHLNFAELAEAVCCAHYFMISALKCQIIPLMVHDGGAVQMGIAAPRETHSSVLRDAKPFY